MMPGGIRRFNVASSTGKLTSRRDLATHIMQPAPRGERKDFSIFDLDWINADVKIDFFGPFVTNCKRDKIEQKQIEALTAGLQKVSAQLEMSKPAPQMVDNH